MSPEIDLRFRLATLWVAAAFALGGCCLSSITGIATAGPGTSGSGTAGGKATSAASTGSSVGGSAARATSSGATTSGTSTGSIPLEPTGVFMDAGANTIFGPVAIAAVTGRSGLGAAKLVYSVGDGGEFGIMLQTLDGDGRRLGDPILVATSFAIPPVVAGAIAPPRVTVSDDGTETAICWEDYGLPWSATVLSPECDPTRNASVVRCASVPENGEIPDASYSNCGASPSLVFNAGRDDTQLFFLGYGGVREGVDEWAYDRSFDANLVVAPVLSVWPTGVPLGAVDGVIYAFDNLPVDSNPDSGGVFLATSAYADGGYLGRPSTLVDPGYDVSLYESRPVAAASNPPTGSVEALDWHQGQLRETIWQIDAGVIGIPAEIQSTVPLIGAIAAGVCPDGFANFMTTAFDSVLVAKVGFDGGIEATPRYLALTDFNQTPGLTRLDNSDWPEPATSLAVAPAPGGKLFLAISNPWQLGVYVVDCN